MDGWMEDAPFLLSSVSLSSFFPWQSMGLSVVCRLRKYTTILNYKVQVILNVKYTSILCKIELSGDVDNHFFVKQ